MILDCIFFISVLLIVIGNQKKCDIYQYVGIFFGSLSKQSIIPFIFFYMLEILFIKKNKRRNVYKIIFLLLSTFLVKYSANYFYDINIEQSDFYAHFIGIFKINYFKIEGLKLLIIFFLKYILFLITIFIAIDRRVSVNKKVLIFVIGFFLLQIQPILGGPIKITGNIQRLCSFSLPFLIPLLNSSKIDLNPLIKIKNLTLCFLVSLHYDFSLFFYVPNSQSLFISILLLIGAHTLFLKIKDIRWT